MRRLARIGFALCLMFGAVSAAAEDGPKTMGDGVYIEVLATHRLVYVVDSIAQQCFAAILTREHFVVIPCGNLVRRAEWRSIITWAEAK